MEVTKPIILDETGKSIAAELKKYNNARKREFDESVVAALDGTAATYKKQMRRWFVVNGARIATPAELTALCDEWYTITRDNWNGWTTFYQPDISAVSAGEKGGDNANLVCTPSTDTTANQDDYAGLPLFACIDCNWTVDAETLEPVITAIDGITDNFRRSDPAVYVGVLQMAGYHYWSEGQDTYTHGYSAVSGHPAANIEPVPEAVRVDCTMRPWVVHGKYVARKTSSGALTCCSGVLPTAWFSHNSVHTASAVNGPQYSGETSADDAWLKLMAYIKYGSLTLDGILQGCCSMNYQYPALVSETGVKRILITTAQATNLEVGMSVLLGTYSSNLDRGQATMYSITGQAGALITRIETVTVDDTEYVAVYVDTSGTFDTAANGANTNGTTYISSFHWTTGKTDAVQGNDGSPVNNTSGKYPAKLQGIEYMVGGYEIIADAILNLYADSDGKYWYEPYIVRRSSQQATSITANYAASGVKCPQPASGNWYYIRKLGYGNGVFFPVDASGGSSSTYTRDAFYMNSNATGTCEWPARGALSTGVGTAGLSCLSGYLGLLDASWCFLARLSASGNRGEWVA